DDFIEVMFLLKKQIKEPFKAVIVGDGPEKEELIKLVRERNLEKEIIFAGFQSDPISYINAFDVFVLTSEREGFPRVILESMLMGKPVVASKIPGVLSLVVDGETGFLVPPKNPQGFTEKISLLIKDPQLRKKLGEQGRKRILKNFSIEKYVEGVEKVFAEVLGKK
ncbi:MAG TPA: glycosyltransferase, partial [Thermodesulfobacterium commune]|nr:glycosyltransferase [Thermodesulfobacterium commune]